jgi:hypothetical protein
MIMLALLLGCSTIKASQASAPDIRVSESQDNGSITQGETIIVVDPDTAYQTVTDYARWSTIFPDIHQVLITRQQGVDARVTLIHAAGNRDNVHFHNQPAARMVWFEDTGGRAEVWVEISFLAGDRPGTTRLHSRLYADVHGFASLFVSDSKIRNLREQRVRDDLSHLRAYFARAIERAVEAQLHPERGPATAGNI